MFSGSWRQMNAVQEILCWQTHILANYVWRYKEGSFWQTDHIKHLSAWRWCSFLVFSLLFCCKCCYKLVKNLLFYSYFIFIYSWRNRKTSLKLIRNRKLSIYQNYIILLSHWCNNSADMVYIWLFLEIRYFSEWLRYQ